MSPREGLRGLVIDWGGVLTNSIRSTVKTWVEAEGIDWDSYVACMRPWLNEAYGGPGVAGNPVHALERGECTVPEFERLFAARLTRTDGGPVPAEGLLGRMFAASETVPAMYDLLRTARAAGGTDLPAVQLLGLGLVRPDRLSRAVRRRGHLL